MGTSLPMLREFSEQDWGVTQSLGYLPNMLKVLTVLAWAWWHKPAIPALRKWRQEESEFKGILSYR